MSQFVSRSTPWNIGVDGDEVLPLINLDAPVIRVEAPPGAGKTFGLARRVVRLLHPDGLGHDGDDILVVAFNRVIAKDLSASIVSQLEGLGLEQRPRIQTVHGLCRSLMAEDGRRLLLPHEREIMVVDILHAHPQLRETYRTTQDAAQALREHEAGHQDHVALWQAARRWLEQHRAKLIGDLPGDVHDRLHGGEFEDERFAHVIVDEFQDLTNTEQQLLARMRRSGGEMVALGDARQSVYAFRGNDRLGLANLENLTGEVVVDIDMPTCRRCPNIIVQAANRLTAVDGADEILASSSIEANVHVVHYTTPAAEAKGMAEAIINNVRTNPNDRHLVMVTRRQFGYALRDEIRRLDDQFRVDLSFSESILELWPVREAFLFFCLLGDPDPVTWRAWLAYRNSADGAKYKPSHRNTDAYHNLVNSQGEVGVAVLASLVEQTRGARRGSGGSTIWDRATRFFEILATQSWETLTPVELIELVFKPATWISPDNPEPDTTTADLELLAAQAMSSLAELPDPEPNDPDWRGRLLRRLVEDLRYRISVSDPFDRLVDADIQVTTLWGAKGLTADHVYVIGLCSEALPGIRQDEYPGTDVDYNDEQRRLFYVAITRTKRTLVLSRPMKVRSGDAQRLNLRAGGGGYWRTLTMSPFLRDIVKILPSSVAGDDWQGCF